MILVDTGPLVALCDPRDSLHQVVRRHLASLATAEFAVCEPVLVETCFHLPYDAQRQRLRRLLEELNAAVLTVHETPGWNDAFDWLHKYAEHEPDWADACLAVASGHHKRAKVWTYDREFRTTWRRLNGSAIPLAVKAS